MAISLRSHQEIQKLQRPNKVVANVLRHIQQYVKPGISTLELDKIIEDYIRSHSARPAFKGLYGFPNSACISVNEVIIHGIPSEYRLQAGDIVGIDVGAEIDGWYGDGAITLGVGEIHENDQKLIDCSKETLLKSIAEIKIGMYFKELSFLLQEFIFSFGFIPLRDYCGHGIGRKPHDEPSIPNYLDHHKTKQGPKIKNGMVFCIEPMVCQKDGRPKVLDDGWSVVASDGLRGSHYEHTVAIVDGHAVILTEV